MSNLFQTKSRLATTVSILALGGTIALYLSKQHLDRLCPRVPVTKLPKSSACRNLIESDEPAPASPWGTGKSVVLSSWPGASASGSAHGDGNTSSKSKTHWVTSFVALQVDVPVEQLERYGFCTKGEDGQGRGANEDDDAYGLSRNLLGAFLDARAKGVEAFFLDRNVPPLSFTPGSLLFGRGSSMGAFTLGSWSSSRKLPLQPPILPAETAHPVSEFLSNEEALSVNEEWVTDAGGTLLYWRFPHSLVNAVNKAASYGLPWRLMDGGFQEFIVERISDETARITYVTVECGDMYPGGQTKRDWKKLPWLVYELHVVYAQVLLWKTLRTLEQNQ
ncbi:uncharacterized protein DSM5745_09839 [Aspergillus mulundensis]|uniref:Uncharacterized protein n=1 Tax=Aspergillus mulundensis TaxID=1810919 RepID=A0A3D8QRX5_9EURO|nr:hypothetical protein DSM5745_09839 [Aspergillus mulundensis]RDW64428.1 hypothetical protein DSM5745_09839 [Aspergillus mulundensis]